MSVTQTEKLRRDIVEGILSGSLPPGGGVLPERELAQQAGCSRVTVRRAYDELVEAGILERGRGKAGTRVATGFRGNPAAAPLIAVIANLEDRFAREFIEAMQRSALAADMLAVLACCEESPQAQAEMALAMAVRGIANLVVWGVDRRADVELFARLRILGVNQVWFDRIRPGDFADYVAMDQAHAMKGLLDLAGKDGYEAVLFVTTRLDADSNLDRERALENECRRRKRPFRKALWPGRLPSRRGGEALFTVNDDVALKLPEQPGVYSIDGSPEATARGVISWKQPMDAMAEAVTRALARQRREGTAWRAREYQIKGHPVLP